MGAGGGHPKRRNHHRIAPVRSLKNLPGIGELALQRNHVATNVLLLLADTVTYHIHGVLKPPHSHWPTRPPPKKVRVNDGLAPHQAAPPVGSASQYHPGGAQSRTWPIWSSKCHPLPTRRRGCRIGIVHVDARKIALTKKYSNKFLLTSSINSISSY